ncbi:hypothetical protein [Robiginitalea sp. SC105]|uniref:hypothetical protein n=1 Tax=Robiginitalea sp. SC105 TaxID=2762332 RepID=UPI00163B1731|nr:hypothetical protein [Robiginitalea sp. SC105]MBC2840355.1 hypothetical protein [Robiginitalea sp. SC105]
MKKLILGAAAFTLLFSLASCETEPISEENLFAVDGKTRVNSDKEEDDNGCETAYGRICDCAEFNSCFTDFGNFGSNNWGWSVRLPEPGSGPFNLFAGAGQCQMEKGTYVGYVNVTYHDDGSLTYGDVMLIDGYELEDFHFYSGDLPMPMKKNGTYSAAPGQYTNEGSTDGNPEVYVIVHASVCKIDS